MYCPDPKRVLVTEEMEKLKQSGFDLVPAPEPTMGNDTMPMMSEWGKWLAMNVFQVSCSAHGVLSF